MIMAKCFADLLSSRIPRRWFYKFASSSPWLSHSFIGIFYNIISMFGKIAGHCTKQLKLLDGDISSYETYEAICAEHKSAKSLIAAATQQSSITSFVTPLASWENFSPGSLSKREHRAGSEGGGEGNNKKTRLKHNDHITAARD